MDDERLAQGLSIALDMLVDDLVSAVVIIGVHADGRGFKTWSGGDERVAAQVNAVLSESLPIPPSTTTLLYDPGEL